MDNKTLILLVVVAFILLLHYDKCKNKSRGLGDTVGNALQSVGIEKKPGCGCKERHKWLNQLVSYAK